MARLACELYFNWKHGEKYAIFTNGTLDRKELDLIFPEKTLPEYEWVPSYIHYAKVVLHKGSINKRVRAALKLGFSFEDEYDAIQWKSGKNFSMFRKGIKSVKKVEYDPLTLKFQEMMLEMNEDEFSSLLVDTYLASGRL